MSLTWTRRSSVGTLLAGLQDRVGTFTGEISADRQERMLSGDELARYRQAMHAKEIERGIAAAVAASGRSVGEAAYNAIMLLFTAIPAVLAFPAVGEATQG